MSPESDGIDIKTKRMLLAYGCELIQKGGILLQLNAITIASAQSILHKFYHCKSLKEFNIRSTSASACFLSCKLEENHRKVDHIVKVFDFLRYYEDPTRTYKSTHQNEAKLKSELLRIEMQILVEFAFRLDKVIVCPHKFVLQYIYALFRNLHEYTSHNINTLAKRAWEYLNDSMRTSLCCEVESEVIAVGCIYLAATSLGIPLKKCQETQWFIIFNVTWEDLVKVCNAISQLYDMGPVNYIEV